MVKLAPELTRLVKFGEERAKRRRRERQPAADAQPPLPEG
jgi:hypothetical protein